LTLNNGSKHGDKPKTSQDF